jgi:hypothetical protein
MNNWLVIAVILILSGIGPVLLITPNYSIFYIEWIVTAALAIFSYHAGRGSIKPNWPLVVLIVVFSGLSTFAALLPYTVAHFIGWAIAASLAAGAYYIGPRKGKITFEITFDNGYCVNDRQSQSFFAKYGGNCVNGHIVRSIRICSYTAGSIFFLCCVEFYYVSFHWRILSRAMEKAAN